MQNFAKPTTRLERLKANANRWGWTKALFNIVARSAARYLGIHVYVVRGRQISSDPEYPATDPDLTFRRIEKDELLEVHKDSELRMSKGFIKQAISRGDLAFGAFDGRRLVSYIWRAVDSAPDADGVWIRVNKPYNYSYKSYTRRGYRGRRISPVVHLFSDNEMRKLGYEYRAGFVAITNYASLDMGKHMGSVRIGYAGYASLFGRLLPFRAAAVKAIGFEFFRPKDPN